MVSLLAQLLVGQASETTGCSDSVSATFNTEYSEPVMIEDFVVGYPLVSLDETEEAPEFFTNAITFFEEFVGSLKALSEAVDRMFSAEEFGDTQAYENRRAEAEAFCSQIEVLADTAKLRVAEAIQEFHNTHELNFTKEFSVTLDQLRYFMEKVTKTGFPEEDQIILNRFGLSDVQYPILENEELAGYIWADIFRKPGGESMSFGTMLEKFAEIDFRDGLKHFCSNCQWDSGCGNEQALCVGDGISLELKCASELFKMEEEFFTILPGEDGVNCNCEYVHATALLFVIGPVSDSDVSNSEIIFHQLASDLSESTDAITQEDAKDIFRSLRLELADLTGALVERFLISKSFFIGKIFVPIVFIADDGVLHSLGVLKTLDDALKNGVDPEQYPVLARTEMFCIRGCVEGDDSEEICCSGDPLCDLIQRELPCSRRQECSWNCDD